MNVWITVISHPQGDNVSANRTEAGALDALYAYVQQNWEDEGLPDSDSDDGQIGAIDRYDKAAAIEMYFDIVDSEYWEMNQLEVDP